MRYHAEHSPDPQAWLELDEAERNDAVLRFHKRIKARAGNLRLHAIIHGVVETQLAEGHSSVVRTLERLVSEGLGRHDAIHALGSLVAGHIFNAFHGQAFDAAEYEHKLANLTAARWRNQGDDD
jgi:hypothetical protein